MATSQSNFLFVELNNRDDQEDAPNRLTILFNFNPLERPKY